MNNHLQSIITDAAEKRAQLERELEVLIVERVAAFNAATGCRVTRLRSWLSWHEGLDPGKDQGVVSIRVQTEP